MRTVHKKHRDVQRAFPAAECAFCGGELYGGDVYWRLCGRVLCGDCTGPWLLDELSSRRARPREVRR